MKILMTGMSARSVGSTKIRYDFVALSDLLHRALEELGHDVVRRVVSTSSRDTLDEFDRVLILVNWVSSLSSMHVHEAGLAMARAGDRVVYYVDDWRTESLGDDLDHHVARDHGWLHHTSKFRKDYYAKLTEQAKMTIRESYLRLIDRDAAPVPLMIPQHPWGDIEQYLRVSKVGLNVSPLTFDPSPLVEVPDVLSWRTGRPRRWVLATLQNHDRWLKKLGNRWPVLQLGGVKKAGGGLYANTKAVVPERKVVEAYGANRGMLVAPYKNAGSGWWRPRYTFALEVGAIVHVGSPDDAARIGTAFTNDLADVEAADEWELDDLQRRQREQFLSHQPSVEETMDRIDRIVVTGGAR